MGIIDSLVKNKEEFVKKVIELIEGKETSIKIDLSGAHVKIGKTKISLDGEIGLTIVPYSKKKG